jgi:glycosyltransferase involved in cell wall biosynthesis
MKQLQYEIVKSKLLVHPSVIEGFGIVLVEAAALGTPFVASDIPTSMALSRSLGSGDVFARSSFDQLVRKVVGLLVDGRKYREYQKCGAKNSAQYDWGRLSEETEGVYGRCL